ncbi:hypothetical protein PGTUg99_002194 [Puccinia graminis f. sp. tritici]|uniref:Uncharacterized protein n=1 Tax=Puccinia graminis f. sp. tritici TaxID=56615 RepID=A0A5B0RR91_PUCGR|nr:hypothetical protein PGTUg99_002194 [Puccinia graminis f. sp. tritici]
MSHTYPSLLDVQRVAIDLISTHLHPTFAFFHYLAQLSQGFVLDEGISTHQERRPASSDLGRQNSGTLHNRRADIVKNPLDESRLSEKELEFIKRRKDSKVITSKTVVDSNGEESWSVQSRLDPQTDNNCVSILLAV